MKKIFTLFGLISVMICFASCGMKECRCYSTNVLTQNDSIINNSTDTVSNFTRNNCEDFNKDETLQMDSVTTVHHSIICTDN
ncbi:MAG: hypothetical protein IKN78_12210 [Bacteroidales bacterium]|nr:hypothetical protein [Bacteroidales bacterium]